MWVPLGYLRGGGREPYPTIADDGDRRDYGREIRVFRVSDGANDKRPTKGNQ